MPTCGRCRSTINPGQDTPEVLRRYAARFHAPADRWSFLTGDQNTIYDSGTQDVPAADRRSDQQTQPPARRRRVHPQRERSRWWTGTAFIRAYFNSTDPEVVQQVLTAVGSLLREQPDTTARTSKGAETDQDRHLNREPDQRMQILLNMTTRLRQLIPSFSKRATTALVVASFHRCTGCAGLPRLQTGARWRRRGWQPFTVNGAGMGYAVTIGDAALYPGVDSLQSSAVWRIK